MLVEEVRCFWAIGKNPPCCDAEDEGGDTLNDHDPAPSALAGGAIHVPDAVGEEATKCTSERGRHKEVANAKSQFALGVEEG